MSEINVETPTTSQYRVGELTLRRVLFATDFSAACQNAWPYALALSRQYHAQMLLVHVIAPSQFVSVPPGLLAEAHRQARMNAESQMKRLRRLHGGTDDLDFETLILEGDISEVLLRCEKERDVDLLVCGTRGHRHLTRLLLGSVAEKLFRQSRCPVLVVPERARLGQTERVHRILHPTDFSDESNDAREYAISLAQHFQAQLIFLHVIEDAGFKSSDDLSRDRTAALDRLHDNIYPESDLPGGVHFEVAFGETARNIARLAGEYDVDLVVMGVHPAEGLAAHEQERTAYRVLLSSHCPVLTVPRTRLGSA